MDGLLMLNIVSIGNALFKVLTEEAIVGLHKSWS